MPENNKLIVPPFNKKDIREIVQKDITDGEIVLPIQEGGTKLYSHHLQLSKASAFPSNPIIIDIFDNDSTPITIANFGSRVLQNDSTHCSVYSIKQTSFTGKLGIRLDYTGTSKVKVSGIFLNTSNELEYVEDEYEYLYGSDVVTEL